MATRRWTRIFPSVVLIGYFSLGIATRAADEVFPVFSWFLFHIVPNKPFHYEVLVLDVENKPLPKPLFFRDARDHLSSLAGEDTALQLMDFFGRAVKSGNEKAAGEYQRTFESTYMPRVTRYALVEVSYQPLEYWKTKAREEKQIRTIEVKGK